jgi:hypothetical protein
MHSQKVADALRSCIDKPVTELVPRILDLFPDIAALRFVAYRPAPTLGERLAHADSQLLEVSKSAAAVHESCGVGFWDAILGIALKRGELGSKFIEMALTHDAAPDEEEFRLSRRQIGNGDLDSLLASPPDGYGIAISSRIEFRDGGEAHLPMLDFRCPHSSAAVPALRAALAKMGQRCGVLVRSPRSYHYYGLELVNKEGLVQFLAKALLIAPIVDARYIAHRMLDGNCRLRLAAVRGKGAAPVVEAVFGYD